MLVCTRRRILEFHKGTEYTDRWSHHRLTSQDMHYSMDIQCVHRFTKMRNTTKTYITTTASAIDMWTSELVLTAAGPMILAETDILVWLRLQPLAAGIKCLVQWLPAGIFSGVFKFQCMRLGKKIVSHRPFLQIQCNKIWQSAYELVYPGKSVHLL